MDNKKNKIVRIEKVVNQFKEIIEISDLDLHEVAIVLSALAGISLLHLEQQMPEETLKYKQNNQEEYIDGYIKLIENMTRRFIEAHRDYD